MSNIRLGIIGMGFAGRQHLGASAAVDGLDVIAVADSQRLDGLPQHLQIFKSWNDLIKSRDIDAVSICLPHHLHRDAALAAIAAGKHVLLEKPIACNLDEAKDIVAAAKKAGITLVVELTHRFYKPMREARAAIEQGVLGKLVVATDRIVQYIPEGYSSWIYSRDKAGGGVALTNGVHMLDRLAFITGKRLSFTSGHAGYTQGMGDAEDTAAMLLQFEDGIPAQFLASWRRGSPMQMDDELTVYGTNGTIRIFAWRGWRFEPLNGEARETHSFPKEWGLADVVRSAMSSAMQEFADAVKTGVSIHPLTEAALTSQTLIDAFYRHVGAV
ncbi:MAG: Gfo/Idh/MocA family oxidoreductase [Phycisphaeraceae bacterium]|nr:Gfo/Idh/MocA family oxidoreductase [Phycisphaeraceae bacterium]